MADASEVTDIIVEKIDEAKKLALLLNKCAHATGAQPQITATACMILAYVMIRYSTTKENRDRTFDEMAAFCREMMEASAVFMERPADA